MKLFKTVFYISLITLFFSSCAPEEEIMSEDHQLLRMPFNEQIFFLDSRGGFSYVYKVDYDFQGLQGDAVITPFVKIAGGSHMTVSPPQTDSDVRYLTIVNNGKPGKVHLVNVEDASDHRIYDLYRHSGGGENVDAKHNNRVRITQVDYDENDFLFIAGRDGFFRVSVDYADMSENIWADGTVDDDRLWAIKLSNNGEITMEDEGEGDDDYFEETGSNLRKPKFRGGDILFTQNSEETGAFETERLISVTQAHGNAALWVQLEFGADSKAINYTAKKLFSLMKVTNNSSTGERGIGKVTGAALVGDNHLMTSHHFTTVFEIRTLSGELIASPKIVMSEDADLTNWNYTEVDGYVKHNWGDMATVQTFDSDFTAVSRVIPESGEGYYPLEDGSELAEVKLYRPGSVVLNNYEVSDDNPEVSKEARRNSSNSDIADIRKKSYKFASLGKENGYMVLKFNNPISVESQTKLQVVETSWNKLPEYENTEDAYRAYPEQASVYVSNYQGRYVGDWVEDSANWTKVGDAFISNNVFELNGVSEFQWVKIVDDNSRTPDGFDVNFVATYGGSE